MAFRCSQLILNFGSGEGKKGRLQPGCHYGERIGDENAKSLLIARNFLWWSPSRCKVSICAR
jgi:hypothetical protein